MNKLLSIKEASKLLRVSESTLRRWEKEKKLIPDERTKGNQRRYRLSSIRPEMMQR
jgi:excisionase family DNA binding protein